MLNEKGVLICKQTNRKILRCGDGVGGATPMSISVRKNSIRKNEIKKLKEI